MAGVAAIAARVGGAQPFDAAPAHTCRGLCAPRPTHPPTLQASLSRLASFARANYDYVEDHIRPVVRRYIPGPVQKKIMSDCWDARPAEQWFQVGWPAGRADR